ncbi:hypothetical protein K2173_010366 [Erythroxylum novogranatense]|uniref:Uncharacterized protein n=1 Tax=Erythroxylum novogranatense TaxID=1862640 RepID=A0AAV8TDM5_9ROSI|nr:hypothetical protein K2173_010366 [Erythroxylum novogranatense]
MDSFPMLCMMLKEIAWKYQEENMNKRTKAKLDDDARLLDFTEKLEAACIGVVESGKMTKDLALIIHGSKLTRDQYVNTEEFIDVVDEELKTRLAIKA